MSEYKLLQDLLQLGSSLGYEGSDLRDFVEQQQKDMREERAREREHAREVQEKEHEEKEKERAFELQRLRLVAEHPASPQVTPPTPTPKPKLPKFDETVDDLDAYLERFERCAATYEWPKDSWASCLCPLLTGKALEAYISMSSKDSGDYDLVKVAILQRYMLTEEGYRQKFRDTNPEKGETVAQYTARMSRYFCRWVELAGFNKNFDNLKDLILREQFMRKCHFDLRMFLKERGPRSLCETVTLTEKYLAAHGGPMFKPKVMRVKQNDNQYPVEENKVPNGPIGGFPSSFERRCFLCNKVGHIAKNCRTSLRGGRSTVNTTTDTASDKVGAVCGEAAQRATPSTSRKIPMDTGSVGNGLRTSLGYVGDRPVSVLRDTGCTGVIVRSEYQE